MTDEQIVVSNVLAIIDERIDALYVEYNERPGVDDTFKAAYHARVGARINELSQLKTRIVRSQKNGWT